MAYHDINRKAEATFRNLFLSTDNAVQLALVANYGTEAGQNVYTGKASGEKAFPCVVVAALGGSEDPPYSGNYMLDMEISVRTEFMGEEEEEDKIPASTALVQAVGDALNSIALHDDLNANAVADFSVMGQADMAFSSSQDGDAWVDTFTLKIYCCPSVVF